jgi:hypothetical protein
LLCRMLLREVELQPHAGGRTPADGFRERVNPPARERRDDPAQRRGKGAGAGAGGGSGGRGRDAWRRGGEANGPDRRRPALLRSSLVAAACVCALAALYAALLAPSARAAESFGTPKWEAGTCANDEPQTPAECTYEHAETNPILPYQQASGHPKYGITMFEVPFEEPLPGVRKPKAAVESLRVDIAAGLASNPMALPRCPIKTFEEDKCPPETHVGTNEAIAYSPEANADVPFRKLPAGTQGEVFNLEPEPGIPLEFGIHLGLPSAQIPTIVNEHALLKGYVSWHREPAVEARGIATGDYHEWFEISGISTKSPLLMSRLIFEGNAQGPGFITLPSECPGTDTSYLILRASHESKTAEATTVNPLKVDGCANMPFEPLGEVAPLAGAEGGSSQSDAPDATRVAVKLWDYKSAAEIDSADPRQVTITMPEGLTLNPSAANGLEACTESQFGIAPESATPAHPPIIEEAGGHAKPIECPTGSRIGNFEIETPDLPPGSLPGSIYVGAPLSSDPASGQEYRVFLAVESARYGVGTRLVGNVVANPATGRLTTTVLTPQLPFTESTVRLTGFHQPPLANPLRCGEPPAEGFFVPFGEEASGHLVPPPATSASPFAVAGCAGTLPFNIAQGTQDQPATARAGTSFTLSLARPDGNQYLSGIAATLPEGLLGSIASVPHLCEEPQAASGNCPAASQIGTVRSVSGSGPSPLELPAPGEPPGPVYLTGPYADAPYGLVVVVPAEHVGPYDYGKIVSRATIQIDPYTTRVTTTAAKTYVISPSGQASEASTPVPLIVGGAPVRLRALTVSINRSGFMRNPTSCSVLATESALTGAETVPATATASEHASTPFQATGCSGLAFKPALAVSTSAKTSRLGGASLDVTLSPGPAGANLREVGVTLPVQLPSRLTTLQKACTEAQFAASPAGCPSASRVGTAALTTPLLPHPLSGVAYLVSHGGAAWPDLDYVLEGDGIKLVEVGHTQIKHGVTSTTYPAIPDAPFTSFHASFPRGPDSLLSFYGSFCTRTITHRRRVALRKHGHLVRRHHRIVFKTRKIKRKVPVTLHMPTTFVGQNGAKATENVKIAVSGCAARGVRGAKVLRPRVRIRGHRAFITVLLPSAGTIRASGPHLRGAHRRARRARRVTVVVSLSRSGLHLLRLHGHVRTRARLRFTPRRARGARHAGVIARVTLVFRRKHGHRR